MTELSAEILQGSTHRSRVTHGHAGVRPDALLRRAPTDDGDVLLAQAGPREDHLVVAEEFDVDVPLRVPVHAVE